MDKKDLKKRIAELEADNARLREELANLVASYLIGDYKIYHPYWNWQTSYPTITVGSGG